MHYFDSREKKCNSLLEFYFVLKKFTTASVRMHEMCIRMCKQARESPNRALGAINIINRKKEERKRIRASRREEEVVYAGTEKPIGRSSGGIREN